MEAWAVGRFILGQIGRGRIRLLTVDHFAAAFDQIRGFIGNAAALFIQFATAVHEIASAIAQRFASLL